MNTSIYISSGALRAYQQRLDTVAHNVSNLNTIGYKRREAVFAENLAQEVDNQKDAEREIGRLTPNQIRVGYGTRLGQTEINMEQGGAQETGGTFDFMIEGKGLFVVRDAANEWRYTRDGSFKQSPASESSYFLVDRRGNHLLDEFGDPIEIETGYDVKLLENGAFQLTNKADPSDVRMHDQRVAVAEVDHPQRLRSVGDNLYALPEGDEGVWILDLDDAEAPRLRQGFLELSNVNMTKEMSELIISQRGFQMNARAVSFADQMLGFANGIINR